MSHISNLVKLAFMIGAGAKFTNDIKKWQDQLTDEEREQVRDILRETLESEGLLTEFEEKLGTLDQVSTETEFGIEFENLIAKLSPDKQEDVRRKLKDALHDELWEPFA